MFQYVSGLCVIFLYFLMIDYILKFVLNFWELRNHYKVAYLCLFKRIIYVPSIEMK
jgi:hypothetical protein